MTVAEYAEKHDITVRTAYRRIRDGRIKAEKKVDGTWTIHDTNGQCNETDTNYNNQHDIIEHLEKQIDQQQVQVEFLQNELTQANQTIASMQERHDMIVAQLTQQNMKMLEDLRGRNIWTRIKMALGFTHS